MRSRFPKLFIKTAVPSAVAWERIPTTAPGSSRFSIRRLPAPRPHLPSQHPLPGATPRALSRMAFLPGGPLRCAWTKRTKPAALDSARRSGRGAGSGLGSARSLARSLAHWQGCARPPPRPACRKAWGSHPRSSQQLCLRRRLGSVGAQRLAATWGTCWSLPAEAGPAAWRQPVRIRTFDVRAAQPLLPGNRAASPLALAGDPRPTDRSTVNTSERAAFGKQCGCGHRARWLLCRFYRFHP